MKVVFDTNIFIAAFVSEGICSKLLARARKRQFELITCPFILKEFERVLKKKFSATHEEVQDAMLLITESAHNIIHPTCKVTKFCRDPDDDNILACLIAAKADYLVTGDADLLELKNFKSAPIVTPRNFELLFSD